MITRVLLSLYHFKEVKFTESEGEGLLASLLLAYISATDLHLHKYLSLWHYRCTPPMVLSPYLDESYVGYGVTGALLSSS